MLGDELRKARTQIGLTQEDLAVRARLSREYVSIVERGRKSPTVAVLLRICAAMGVPAWKILRQATKKM